MFQIRSLISCDMYLTTLVTSLNYCSVSALSPKNYGPRSRRLLNQEEAISNVPLYQGFKIMLPALPPTAFSPSFPQRT